MAHAFVSVHYLQVLLNSYYEPGRNSNAFVFRMGRSAALLGPAPPWLGAIRVRPSIALWSRLHDPTLGNVALAYRTGGLAESHNRFFAFSSVTTGAAAHVADHLACSSFADKELDVTRDDPDIGGELTLQQGVCASNRAYALKEIHELLVQALGEGDMPMVTHGWSKLQEMNPLTPGTLSTSYSRQYSEMISALDLQGKTFDPSIVQALDELAVSTVPYNEGLCSRAHLYLKSSNPDAALCIVQMTYSFLQERNSQIQQLWSTVSADEYVRIMDGSVDICSLPYKSIMYAIAACVMKNSFSPML